VILARGELVEMGDLPEGLRRPSGPGPATGAPAALSIPPGTPMDEVERLVIRETLRQTRGDKTLAAQILGIAPRTIYRKLDRDDAGRLVERPGGSTEESDPA
jgi:two-component system response regulator HydG